MTILVFGKTGQVSRELAAQAQVVSLGREEADLSDPAACVAAITAHAPNAVINAAAYTAVDKAEEEEALATIINGDAPAAMARECAARDIPFVHISTDYVFNGSGETAWQVEDPLGPLGAYGRSKLAGEQGVRAAGGRYAILRTSWVFSAHGANFLKTMLRLAETRSELNVVADQIGGPTPAAAIAEACLAMADQLRSDAAKAGTYHFSGAPDASWADFARAIFVEAGKDVTVHPIPSSEYPTPAVRPLNSRMDCTTTQAVFGIPRPDWRDGIRAALQHI
jgi:dTDP-4-dehydrorhamnose reductase